MSQVFSLLREKDTGGKGAISFKDFGSLMHKLDEPAFWTEDRLSVLFQSLGGGGGDSLAFGDFVLNLYTYAESEYQAVREDLLRVMDSPTWDDGSYAPLLIRLAWHSSGTYCKADGTGGSNGATMRHALEAGDPENAGLDHARQLLEPVREKHPWLSYADLWIFAAYVAIEHTGGPRIKFTGGRTDLPAEHAVAPGRLPGAERGLSPDWQVDEEGRMVGWENLAQHVRDVFGRMGLDDQEAVALLCGGHVYGRCHTESSGFAGAWVENPTFFSNEYAADMIGDEWIPVMHDTVLPEGCEWPEEVRPAPGKRQYINLTKLKDEDDDEAKQALAAPDATQFPPGRYRCVSQWVNCREQPDVESPIQGRFVQDDVLHIIVVKTFGTAVRGLAERGGWVSVIGSGGKTLFERVGDFDLQALAGTYRALNGGVCVMGSSQVLAAGAEFHVEQVSAGAPGEPDGALFGQLQGGERVLLSSPAGGLAAELVVPGYNEQPRKPIKGQTGHQMMLVSDMVLLWDQGFREHLEVYAEDEDKLKEDFGVAFKKLTELGCPWSEGWQDP